MKCNTITFQGNRVLASSEGGTRDSSSLIGSQSRLQTPTLHSTDIRTITTDNIDYKDSRIVNNRRHQPSCCKLESTLADFIAYYEWPTHDYNPMHGIGAL